MTGNVVYTLMYSFLLLKEVFDLYYNQYIFKRLSLFNDPIMIKKYITTVCCFFVAICSVVSVHAEASGDSLQAQIVRDWERAKKSTLEFVELMSEEGYAFKPTPEMRSFAEQLLHGMDGTMNIIGFATGVKRDIYKVVLDKEEQYKNKATIKQIVTESYDWIIKTIRQLNAEQLFQASKANAKYTCYAVLAAAYEHQTHHRSQTVVYLRLMKLKPPPERLF